MLDVIDDIKRRILEYSITTLAVDAQSARWFIQHGESNRYIDSIIKKYDDESLPEASYQLAVATETVIAVPRLVRSRATLPATNVSAEESSSRLLKGSSTASSTRSTSAPTAATTCTFPAA